MLKFGKKEEGGAANLPEPVTKFLVEQKWEPQWLELLRAVTKGNGAGLDIRVFDPAEVSAKGVKVKDYMSLDQHPELTLYEGHLDPGTGAVNLARKPGLEVKSGEKDVLAPCQIWRKIAGLGEPGSVAHFYLGASPASGGPFGRGAAVVERNPEYPGKKAKKYNIYTVDVDGTQLKGKGQKLWDSDKVKDIVAWIAERHHPGIV